MVVIRLARFGKRNDPVYKIFVSNKAAKLTGRHLEKIGHYRPGPKPEFVLNGERFKYWLSVGAQTSPRLDKLVHTFKGAELAIEATKAPVQVVAAAKTKKKAAPAKKASQKN